MRFYKPQKSIGEEFINKAKEAGVNLVEHDDALGLDIIKLSASFRQWKVTVNIDKLRYRSDPLRCWKEVLVILLNMAQNDGAQIDTLEGKLLQEIN